MKTLLELLNVVDAISLDDTFVRCFRVEEQDDDPDAIVLDVSSVLYEYLFTNEEINNAKYNPANNSWIVADGDGGNTVTIVCYNLNEIKP